MKIIKKHPYLSLLLLLVCSGSLSAQNIVGLRIIIGSDAPAFLAFPTEVDNARWDNNEMNEYFKFSTRNENTMQISYNGKKDPPVSGTGFSVIQGKNTHLFTLVFKKDYDINKDPVLYYDFSDKSKLKSAAEKAKAHGQGNPGATISEDQAVASAEVLKKQDQEDQTIRRKEEEQRKKEMSLAQQQKKKEIEAQQKAEAEKVKQQEKTREAEIAKAKADARQTEAEQKKAKEQADAIAKANAEAGRKKAAETEQLKKEQDTEDKRLALQAAQQKEKDKQEADKVKVERDRIAREAAEQKRLAAQQEKERITRAAQEKADKEREQKAETARRQAEVKQKAREEAEARLLALQKEKEEAKKNTQYTLAGLWNRYGKKGINLYEIPPEQFNFNNTDFYVSADTVRNFEQSNIFLAEAPRLNISSETRKEVSIALKSISFKGAIAYYRIEVKNDSKEDYLVGANNLAWYNPDSSPKNFLKCSYLTHIGFFPLVKPGEHRDYIYATRAANINDDDKMVFTVNERRPDAPKFEIFFDGSVYRRELARVETPIGVSKKKGDGGPAPQESRKERKEREKKEKKNKVKNNEE